MKIALGFRFAQTLLNLALARFIGAIFTTYLRDFEKKQKQKQSNSEFASLMSFLLATLDLKSKLKSSHTYGMLCNARD